MQRRKGKICALKCRVPKNSKERLRKPFSVISAKKQRKIIEWERLEIYLRKLEILFYAKMGTIEDRNGMDLAETENIKKRWQEYTEELYKKRSS